MRILVMAFLLAVLSGCARANIDNEVSADGSWNRVVELHGSAPGEDGTAMGTKIEDVFTPPKGEGWSVHQSKTSEEATYKAERHFAAGAVCKDFVMLGGPKSARVPQVENEATVHRLGAHRWEYLEYFRWKGPPKSLDDDKPDAEVYKKLRQVIGDETVIKAVLHDANEALWHEVMGPPEPLLGQLLTGPEQATHRIQRDLGLLLDRSLQQHLGNHLDAKQRAAAARQMLEVAMSHVEETRTSVKSKSQEGENKDDSGLVSISVSVKVPGRIVETNGLRDDINSVVSWGWFGDAPQAGEVKLQASWEDMK